MIKKVMEIKPCKNNIGAEIGIDLKKISNENIQSITDIALQLGYAETAVFSRHFRRWTGKSPRQWRQEKTQLQTFKPIS